MVTRPNNMMAAALDSNNKEAKLKGAFSELNIETEIFDKIFKLRYAWHVF